MVVALTAIGFTACKTTEENYRKAYDIAKAKQTEGLTQEEIAAMNIEESMPRTIFQGDSIPLRSEYLALKEGGGDLKKVYRYNVVVASFRQLFNARSVLGRLVDAGYANASLLVDGKSRYYLSLSSTDSLQEAVDTLSALQNGTLKPKCPIAPSPPCPYILQNPSVKR